ncbi:MAG: transcriptional regulator [Elusimicrobia bacterium CG1_02_63_36]|nr:MAG: transcriptional regulator [Elusimicrobia bacterium CG1_02_63_36]PIP83913.1 MAG: transcriptional regulator [Elusimicrobia bacterium CG22_combo_CG10-13_8_21_14_all_63_91]PJA11752.1 MAG: transcriptional regulator [Elusimicrobia bacterium CG_4_10_14_0_2_um_filter_63_34]PJB24123.1 MAG: transcriptional regulator [Elusimicrobia bacterium CG_4_9_14_3_um_filter_62_55]
MPEISRFYGIVIYIYFREHDPPHFHAVYGEHEAVIDIRNLGVLAGHLPARSLGLVTEWAALRREEIQQAWDRARNHQMPGRIDPLP